MSSIINLCRRLPRSKWIVVIPLAVFTILYFGVNQGLERLTGFYLRGDERVSLNVASDIFKYSVTQGPYNVTGYPTGIGGFWSHPPLYYIIISPIVSSLLGCRLLSLSMTYVSIVLVYILAEKRASTSGVLAATAFAVIPSFEIRGQEAPLIIRGDIVTMDALWLMLMVLTLACVEYEKYNFALVLCSLGVNVKYPYALVLLPLLLINRRRFIHSIIVAGLALIPFAAWSYIQGGDLLMLRTWGESSSIFATFYLTPGWHFLILLSIVVIGMLHRKLSLKRTVPLLLVVAGNLAQFYMTPARRYYYMFPSYIVLSVIVAEYLLLLAKHILTKLSQK